MMNSTKSDNVKLFLILTIFLSFAFLLAIADRAPLHLEKNCSCIHLSADINSYVDGIVNSTAQGPYVYRVFIPFLTVGIHNLFPFLSFVDIDLLLKIFLLLICQLTFYYFLRNFFTEFVSFAGVLILDILLSFTFSSILGPSIGENADLINLIVFTLSLIALYKNSLIFFLIILFLGTFNRETTWFLVPILFLIDMIHKRKLIRTIFAFLAVAIPYIGLRIIIQPSVSQWFTFEGIERNIPFLSFSTTPSALIANAHTFFLLGPLIILSILEFNKNSKFLQVASYITPLFIIIHYIFGSIIETRLWIPLFVLLIPLSLTTLTIRFNKNLFASNSSLTN